MSDRFTKRQAVILAGMLSEETCEIVRCFRDRKNLHGNVRDLNEAQGLGLIEEREDLLSGKNIWVLTAKGKKVGEAVQP